MPQATMTYVLSHIRQEIPKEILELAFEPRRYNTSIEQRIVAEVIEGPILLEANLLGGKRREIFMQQSWEMPLDYDRIEDLLGDGIQGSFYEIPPEARENRNIASVIGPATYINSSLPGASVNYNGQGGFGNTASAMMSTMLNTRTFGQYPIMPQVTLEGSNIVRFYPRQVVDGTAISVLLEYDAEFLNVERSAIWAIRNVVLAATKRYIATKLLVKIDETEVVAGMEIGIIKELVNKYAEEGQQYDSLLIKLKGAMSYDSRTRSRIISFGL